MAKTASFHFWKTLFGVIAGSITGGLAGELAAGVRGLSWLSMGGTVGISPPLGVDLGFLTCTLGVTLHINIAVILFIIIFVLLFRKIF
jgi:hypothetical protein